MNAARARIRFEDLDPDLRSINATEAKNTFGTVLMDVLGGERLQVNRNTHAVAVIVGYDHFRRMAEHAAAQPTPDGAADLGTVMESLDEIPATEAKNNFGTMLMDVLGGRRFAVKRNTRLAAVIVKYDDYHTIWRRSRDATDAGAPPEAPPTHSSLGKSSSKTT
ncbi:MAG: type II toxin-antitoxin system Phd/YefM family antitoxin [Planctomycetota bacterium]